MATYGAEYSETFSVDVPIGLAKAHFADLEIIAANYGGVEDYKVLKNNTLKLVLEPRHEVGVTFNGQHSCKWEFADDTVLKWKSVGKGNMRSTGTARFESKGAKKTEIEYYESMECDMEVNFLLGAVIGPIVSRQIRDGVKDYLKRMRASLAAAQKKKKKA